METILIITALGFVAFLSGLCLLLRDDCELLSALLVAPGLVIAIGSPYIFMAIEWLQP